MLTYEPSSSVSAKSSAMSILISTTSKTIPASDTAGPLGSKAHRVAGWAWSLTAKTVLLAVIFVLVPVFLYIEFHSADQDSQELLLRSARDEGRVISQSLLPLLEAPSLLPLLEAPSLLPLLEAPSLLPLLEAPSLLPCVC